MPIGWGTKEYREGYRAFEENYPRVNPYIVGSAKYSEFYLGYMRAKMDLKATQSTDEEGEE